MGLWEEGAVPRTAIAEIKKWLGELYIQGDPPLRTCIVTATLEHLFEQRRIRDYFSDWRDDPVLRVAYEEAVDWVRGGGSTPLGKPLSRKVLSGEPPKKEKK